MIVVRLVALTLATMASGAVAVPSVSVGATSSAIAAGPTSLGETSAAVDPTNNDHVVVLADRYGAPTTIVMVDSYDGGRTWSRARALVPPGFTTTYDSDVRFTSDGGLIVAGGAARPTSPGCNADSAIFVADVDAGGRVSYRVVRAVLGLNRFTDRPALAVDASSDLAVVSWTESHGSLAACRGRPTRSSIFLSQAESGESFSAPARIPSSGLPAPYGSAVALLENGSVLVAVGEYGPSGDSRLVVTESPDKGRTFTTPVVLASRPAVTRRWKWRGWVLGVPSLAARGKRVAVSWVDTTGARQTPMAYERTAQGWMDIRPTGSPDGDVLLTTIRFGDDGTLWLATASIAGSLVTFAVDRRLEGWGGPQALTFSRASFRELGELVGVDSAGSTTIVAVPVDAPERSKVLAFRVSTT